MTSPRFRPPIVQVLGAISCSRAPLPACIRASTHPHPEVSRCPSHAWPEAALNVGATARGGLKAAPARHKVIYLRQILQITPVPGIWTSGPLLAPCRLPKLDRGTGRAVGIERRWSAMSLVLAHSLSWAPGVQRSGPIPISRWRTWRSGSNSLCSATARSDRGSGASSARFGFGSLGGGQAGGSRSTSFAPRP